MSDADCEESEGAAQPELRDPAGHTVRLRYRQGHKAARCFVPVKVFSLLTQQVAYYRYVTALSSLVETTKHFTLEHHNFAIYLAIIARIH